MTAKIYEFRKYAEKKEHAIFKSVANLSVSSTGSAHSPEDESFKMIQALTEVIYTCEYCAKMKAVRQ
ncbi:MAG: hypothetical protein KAG61_04050 [Bacteriovoracaceae bacterium]|nr:hypothetical protein [Bacteriovoracaceae bacterium]